MKDWQYYPCPFKSISSGNSASAGWTYVVFGGIPLARQNFKYEKRQKELAKQKKAEEKRLRKLEKRGGIVSDELSEAVADDTVSENSEPVTPSV